ncbi:MAG: hypothetical protein M0001_07020 [Treponema sp.]|nr:hypothetical protein [Treponema sp.]
MRLWDVNLWVYAFRADSPLHADEMTHGIFKHLCLTEGASGNAVPDAFLAALAIRHDATFVTADAGMKRWKGLGLELLTE